MPQEFKHCRAHIITFSGKLIGTFAVERAVRMIELPPSIPSAVRVHAFGCEPPLTDVAPSWSATSTIRYFMALSWAAASHLRLPFSRRANGLKIITRTELPALYGIRRMYVPCARTLLSPMSPATHCALNIL